MRHAAVGCLIGLGGWLLLAAALSAWLQRAHGVAMVDTLGVSALAGLAAWAALNLLHAAWQAARERAAIAGGQAGRAPADGKRVVLVGTLQPLGRTLRAPLDGSECLAYDYRVTEDRGSGRRRMILTHARGSALAPSVIVTPSGRYRLLTVPDLQASPPTTPSTGHIAAFERHARSTRFTTRAADAAQELVDRWTDDDGAYRADVCYTALDRLDLTRCMLTQQQVRPGAPVCVIGHFDQARGGVVPSPAWAGNPRLIEGGPAALLRTLGGQAVRRLLLGGAIALAALALVAAFVADRA